MGYAYEDFINAFIYDLPNQKRFTGADVVKWKHTRQLSDDWDANVGGNYMALVYKKGQPYAIINYKVVLDDRYDKNEDQPYSGFEEAADIKMGKIKLIKSVPKIFK